LLKELQEFNRGVKIQDCLLREISQLTIQIERLLNDTYFDRISHTIEGIYKVERRIEKSLIHYYIYCLLKKQQSIDSVAIDSSFTYIHILSDNGKLELLGNGIEDPEIFILIPVKNRAKALKRLFKNLKDVIEYDEKLKGFKRAKVLIVDLGSDDIDIPHKLKRLDIPYIYLSSNETWNKVKALQRGIDYVPNAFDIIFVLEGYENDERLLKLKKQGDSYMENPMGFHSWGNVL